MLSFEELTEARRLLRSFCLLHVPSLLKLQSGISFKLFPSEAELDTTELRHLTTTATCLSSLFDCPPGFRIGEFRRAENVRAGFAEKATAREDWTSEGSAGVYCRCRALPMVIKSSKTISAKITNHIEAIFGQIEKKPERFGIGEADPQHEQSKWYPPNAFHTYWTLEILRLVKSSFPADYEKLSEPKTLDLKRRSEGMLLWARQQLGYQLGLHSPSPPSSVLDSDQLAWSLAIFLRFDRTFLVNLENRDFVKQALKCLFSTQTDGTWRHYKPLFHYEEAGNAYCYVFETFAVLLECALQEKPEAEMIRELLRPYSKNLIDLWRYADSTRIPLSMSDKEVGWCSGHRTNITEPESWATASIFSYAQALRRLIGIWTREDALASLNTPQARLTPEKAADEMASRGETWGVEKRSASEQLWTMFINPVLMHECNDKLEPDSRPIEEKQARAAILFGPPGTSKTFLVRSLAEVIAWRYVEIHASHFVAEGLGEVQKTADRIFKQLSELDHSVVLFDEIDELVRERDMEKDAFGRFLTTSMLPKLAELWEEKRILYFVATNHINYFDSAIIRSHRFDVLMLVSPPSFARKIDRLTRLLSNVYGVPAATFETSELDVQQELEQIAHSNTMDSSNGNVQDRAALREEWGEQELKSDFALAKFALLRWDELDELANRLSTPLRATGQAAISTDALRKALMEIADSQWRKNKSYLDYLRDMHSERRDFQMLNVWRVEPEIQGVPAGVTRANKSQWLQNVESEKEKIQVPGYELTFEPLGRVRMQASDSKRQL